MCTNTLMLSQATNPNPKVRDTASSWGSCLSPQSDPENLGQIVPAPLTKGSYTVESTVGWERPTDRIEKEA